MECRGCGRENRADSRFCDACGSALAVRCSACDRELNPDARFCDGCGTAVATAGGPPAAPAATSPDTEAVRKTVTVLFCDLVGSTAFAESVDTESAREAMSRYHSMAKSMIEGNGGTVAKFIGDGVMALFGVPEVAEDDAERAVASGAALQRGFEPVREHIAKRYGVEVGLRVGINTGEVVIDDADADLVGDVLNTAARLEAACTPGHVLVGEETWRLTRSAVGYEPLGEVTVKGKRDGLATFQLVLADDGSGFAIGGIGHPDATPFIGRDVELDQLRALFEETLRASEARLATIIGSPGVGKTRLARELGNTASAEADVVEVRCERAGTATFAPIVDLLQQVAGLDDGDTPEQIVAALRGLVGGEPDAERVVELLGGFVGTASPRSTEDAFFGVRRLVEVLGGHRPLVLVIDDIQWAEPLFLDLLEHLAEWSKAAPVLIVGLARPELREIRPALTETGRRVALVVSLEGLDPAATELLAAELLGGAALPSELTAKLPSSTDGNPLFVRELIRMLVDDGVIAQRNDGWELAVDLDAVAVPPTIQSLLATRIERLPPIERRILEQASVIGPEFPLGALAELVPEIDRGELEAVLERLRRKEQVEPTGTYWGDEPIVRFHHVLIRDAAYRRLLKGARAELHLRVGDWMDRTASGLVGEFEVAIAYHFEQAQLYRRQLGDDDATTAEAGRRAAELLHVAASRALERDDLSAASGLSRRAIDCHTDDAESLPELLVLACESVLSSGDATTGSALVKRLSERALGDARLKAWATCFAAQLAVMTDPTGLQQATEQTQEAADQFEALGDQAGLAKARIVRAGALARLGRVGECEAELDLALTAARAAGDRRRITAVLSSAPVAALWGPSPVARAGGRCLDVVRLSRITADSPSVVATSSRCQAVLEAMRGRFDTARSLLDASRTTSLELGLDHGLLETSLYAGIVELLADDPLAAEPHLRHAFGGLGQLGIGADAGQAAAHLARALLLQGRLDEADELAADSDALAGQNLQTAIAARSAQAEILAARGDADAALALADEAVRLATDTDLVFDHASALSTLARVRAAAGDVDGAQRAASAARDLFAQKGATVSAEVVVSGSTLTAPPAEAPSGPSGESALGDPADEPWNEADRLFRRWMRLFEEGDVAAWEARVHDEVRGSDRRSGVHFTFEGRVEFVRFMALVPETFGPVSIDMATIATRGDEFVLTEMHWTRVGDTAPMGKNLVITRMSEGLLLISITFDARDLRAAVVELDRLYLETLDPIEGAAFGVLARSFDHLMDRDLDKMLAGSDPNIAFPDHRQIGWEHRSGTAELGERFRTLTDLDGALVSLIRNPLRQSPSLSCNRIRHYFEGPDGGQLVDDSVLMNRLDPATGLGVQIDQFADDQLDEARACFDAAQAEVDAAVPAPNTAVRVGGVANARARTASLDEFLAMFADDFTATLADGSIFTLDDLRTGTIAPVALGYGVVDRRIMSVLTDRLAMLYVGFDDGTGHWSVEEIDDNRRLHSVQIFKQLVDAADAIDARYGESDPDGIPAGWIASARAWRRGNIDALEQVYSDDFVYVEHRPLGFPSGDREHYLAMCRASADIIRDAPLVISCAFATDPGGCVMRIVAVSDPGGPGKWESLVTIVVFTARGGLINRLEGFADDDLDSAMARYHELTGTTPPADAPPVAEDEPWNDADRWMCRANELRTQGHSEEFVDLLAEDIVSEDRQTLAQHIYRGRDEVLAGFQSDVHPSIDADTIACRGNLLVLQHHVWRYPSADVEYECLYLTRWNTAGQIVHAVFFDPGDLRSAFEQLDSWYIEELSPIDAAQARTMRAFAAALNNRDLERAVRALSPTATLHTDRPPSFGALDHDGIIASLEAITTMDGDVAWAYERVDISGSNSLLGHTRHQVTDTHGSVMVSTWVACQRKDAASGLIEHVENFEPDAARQARELADRWAAETAADPMVNTAVIAGGLVNALARYGEPGDVLCLLADDFTATLADGSIVTLQDLRDGNVDAEALGFGVTQRETIAVRGERLALTRIENSRWSVGQLDDHDRLTRVMIFAHDDLLGAANALDDVAQVLPENAHIPEWMWAYLRAHRNYDLDAFAGVHGDEFVQIDHRPMGYASMGKTEVVDLIRTGLDDPTLRAVPVYRVIHEAAHGGFLVRGGLWMRGSSDDYWMGQPYLNVARAVDAQIVSSDLYPVDDLDAATARFHQLNHGTRPPDRLWNDAHSRSSELHDAPLEPVALRGEHLVLYHLALGTGSLRLDQWSAEGQLERTASFDPDDLAGAVHELNAWYANEVGFDPVKLASFQYDELLNARNAEAFLATLDPSCETVDHRPIGWGTSGVEGVRDRLESLVALPDDYVSFEARIHRSTATVHAYTGGYRVTGAEGAVLDEQHVLVYAYNPATGLAVRGEQFPLDALDAALARADQLAIEFARVPAPNRAVVTGGSANRWARARQTDLFLDHFADEFTATLTDGSTVTRDDLRTERVDPSALGYGVVDRKDVAVRGDRLALLLVEDCWSVEEIGNDGRLVRLARFAYADLRSAVDHLEARTLTHDDAPKQAHALVTLRRAVRERDADALDATLHSDFGVTDRRPLGFEPMDRDGFVSFMRHDGTDESFASVPVISEVIASSEHGSVARNAMWSGGASGEFWQTTPAINVIMVRDDLVVSMDMFADDDLDAAVARFHELDVEAHSDGAWNRADRVARGLARLFSTGRIGEASLSEDVVMDDRRPLVRHTYVGRNELVAGFSTTGAIRPWAADVCDTLAIRAETLVLWTQRWSKVDDPGTVMESLVIHRIDAAGLIDRLVVFDIDDLAAAVDELDRLYDESLEPTDLLDHRLLAIKLHYDALNTGDLDTSMVTFHPSSMFIDRRSLGWGALDITGIRDRMQTLAESPDQFFLYMRRVILSSSTCGGIIGRNHTVTAEGFVNDSDILSIFTIDPTTGLSLRTEQFDPDDLDAALARLDELVAAESTMTIPPNRAVLAGGLANLRARHPQPDRFIDGLTANFTATLPDGSTVTVDDLRAGTVAPTDLGFGVTERESVAVRGERLAMLRIEGSRWSIEETDDRDRLVRVTLFDSDDLLAAAEALDDAARILPESDDLPEWLWIFQTAHRNYDFDALATVVRDDFRLTDHRSLGYEPTDTAGMFDIIRAGLADPMLRAVPINSVFYVANERGGVFRGGLWMRGASDDYWLGRPFLNVVDAADGRIVSMELFAENDLDGAMTRFAEISAASEPPNAERWKAEITQMINERRLDAFAARLAAGFTEHSRRTGLSFVLDRERFTAGLHVFAEQDLSVTNATVAVAGDLASLQRCNVSGDGNVSSFLQIGVFDTNGNLTRLIEFDDDALDDALAELAHISGEPITLVDPPPTKPGTHPPPIS